MTIILALCIPLAFVAGGFIAYKGVQLGLRWQLQVQAKQQPTMEIKSPVNPFVERKQKEETNDMLQEWFNGTQDGK